jgi:nitrous oxidase accessory protein NosD
MAAVFESALGLTYFGQSELAEHSLQSFQTICDRLMRDSTRQTNAAVVSEGNAWHDGKAFVF